MVYKNTFPLVIYAIILILSIGQVHENHINTIMLEIPQKKWQCITYEQAGETLKWEYLEHGAWILELPNQDVAISVNEEAFLHVLSTFSQPVRLELVSHWLLNDQALEKYGLSKKMRTTLMFKTGNENVVLYLGHRTPSGQEIYVLDQGKVYKGRLSFIFDLEASLKTMA